MKSEKLTRMVADEIGTDADGDLQVSMLPVDDDCPCCGSVNIVSVNDYRHFCLEEFCGCVWNPDARAMVSSHMVNPLQ